jgi:B12-binding domain/radical SAM domain protein
MGSDLEILFWDLPERRTAINVLVGALEQDPCLMRIPVHFETDADRLRTRLIELLDSAGLVVLPVSFATPAKSHVYALMQSLKAEFQDRILSIAGGPHPSGDPHHCLKHGFDVVVQGAGERNLISLLHGVLSTGRWPTERIITTKQEHDALASQYALDAFPAFAFKSLRFNSIEITRGCLYSCAYCQIGFLHGHRMVHRSVGNIQEHIQYMRKNGLKYVRFITPNALSYGSGKGREVQYDLIDELLAVSREAIGPDGKVFLGSFPSEIRPDYVDEKIVLIMKKHCSNHSVVLGAQSGSDAALARIGRQHTAEDVVRAVDLFSSHGFSVDVDLIFGLPGETDDEICETEKFVDRIIGDNVRIHGHVFMPLPGSRYAGFPPGKISLRIRKLLDRLMYRGYVYGQWRRQEAMAAEISSSQAESTSQG